MRQRVSEYIISLQDKIVQEFESLDPDAPAFKQDAWVRPQGGSGRSCVFSSLPRDNRDDITGPITLLEKAGINTSIVHGILPPAAVEQMRADHVSMPLPERNDGLPFFAAGISLVIHPRNPHAPTVHANYRYFEITEKESTTNDTQSSKLLAWWFGGGSDLTPSYLFESDATHFHQTLKMACDRHGRQIYPAIKKWCDEYFFLPHRSETRGVGGIFFDDLNEGNHARLSSPLTSSLDDPSYRPVSQDQIFQFVKDLGNSFIPSYFPILALRHSMPYTPRQRRWQLIRRGRYVEFNLVYDRGTKFGLMTPGARIESILMSLPETARWEYMCDLADEGIEEAKLVEVLRHPRAWVE